MILYNFQSKVYELLSTNAEIDCKIYDYVPEDKPLPYIVIGDDKAIPWNTKTSKGKEITTTIHVWSDTRGNLQVKKLLGLIEKTLDKNFEKDGYNFEHHETGTIDVTRESVELTHGSIELTYRVMEV